MVTRLDILQSVLIILETGTEVHNLLLDNGIISVRNLLNVIDGSYQSLVDNYQYKCFVVDMDQFFFLLFYYQYYSLKNSNLEEHAIIYNITETEWYYL